MTLWTLLQAGLCTAACCHYLVCLCMWSERSSVLSMGSLL